MNAQEKLYFNMAKNHVNSQIEHLARFHQSQMDKSNLADNPIQAKHDLKRSLEQIGFAVRDLQNTMAMLEQMGREGGNQDV